MISVTPNRLFKTQIFQKKAIFPAKKGFWPILSQIVECDKPQLTTYKSLHAILTITVEVTGSFL